MKPDESPFFQTRVECPVCKTVNDFETIKMGAYTESGRDTDFCPTDRVWRNPKYQGINPLLYFMATCSSCFYTREFNRKFREWKDDNAFRNYRQKAVRQKHLGAFAEDGSVLKRLGTSLWPASYPTETAINKLLLGILDESMLEQPSHFDIGRWYLRIGWLFRDKGPGMSGSPSPRAVVQVRMATTLRDLSVNVGRLTAGVTEVRQMVDGHPEATAAGPDDTDKPDRFRRTIASVTEHLDAVGAGIETLLGALQDEGVNERTAVVGQMTDERYGDAESHSAFLSSLRGKWDGVPASEWDALSLSLEHYRKAYVEERDIPQGNTQIQLAYMIGELARRVGQYDEAMQFFNVAVRSGRDWMHKLNNDQTNTALAKHLVELALEQSHRIREALAVAG